MTQVDFYILKSDSSQARLQLACKIAEKAMLHEHHVFIHTDTPAEAETLDTLLWTFSQSSFVPHRRIRVETDAAGPEPVVIGSGVAPGGERWNTLINLAPSVPEFFSRYERVAEVIDGNLQRRNAGRERFRYYRDRGYELNTHEIENL